MKPEQWEAICARDAVAILSDDRDPERSPIPSGIRDRRAMIEYVKELLETQRKFGAMMHEQMDKYDALKAAAGKVKCYRCESLATMYPPPKKPCPDCADLRRLLG